jgi:GTP-binding protein Era
MKRFGSVALVGRPNAGKSTLLNRLLGEKLAITSDKPQTTRRRLLGILTAEQGQIALLDTPGTHRPLHRLNRQMMDEVREALREADVVCVLIDVSEAPGGGETFLLDLVGQVDVPRILVLNKIDLVKKNRLLPRIAAYAEQGLFAEIVPVSAAGGDGCDRLLEVLWRYLPEGPPRYDAELLTTQPERFLVAERIREKVLAATRDELPFSTAVVIERWEEDGALLRLHASILVDRPGQKGILIGKQGSMIKAIGTAARVDLEEFLGRQVYLALNVRHEPGWREDPQVLSELDRDLRTDLSADPSDDEPED